MPSCRRWSALPRCSSTWLPLCTLPCLSWMRSWAWTAMGRAPGDPFPIGAILAAPDPVALDVAALALVGQAPTLCPRWRLPSGAVGAAAASRTLALVGDGLDGFRVEDIRMPRAGWGPCPARLPSFVGRLGARVMVARPFVTMRCVGCGQCRPELPGAYHRPGRGPGAHRLGRLHPLLLLPPRSARSRPSSCGSRWWHRRWQGWGCEPGDPGGAVSDSENGAERIGLGEEVGLRSETLHCFRAGSRPSRPSHGFGCSRKPRAADA